MTTTPEVRFCVQYLLEHGVNELNFSEVASSVSVSDPKFDIVERPKSTGFYLKLAEKLRELWPTGNKIIRDKDGTGHAYEWRCSKAELARRLELMWSKRLKGKSFTIDECLAVARRYLAQYESDTRFMQTLKYFVLKQKDVVDGRTTNHIIVSKFADMLEGKADDDAVQNEWEEMLNSGNLGEGKLI